MPHLHDLPQNLLEDIFSHFDLKTRFDTRGVCRYWSQLHSLAWRRVRKVDVYELFEDYTMPKGRELNKVRNLNQEASWINVAATDSSYGD